MLTHQLERDNLVSGNYVPREGLKEAKNAVFNDLIKVIVGPRRAGKSIFSVQLLKKTDFAYVNFDDERIASVQNYDEILKGLKEVYGETKHVLFDEIQNLSRWELFVNRLQRAGYNLILTGSNSRLLSTELATHLTGRHLPFQILPFSFKEFLRARKVAVDETTELKERQGLMLHYLDDYMKTGGYPEVVLKKVESPDYLRLLVESVLFKDVAKRFNIRFSKKMYDLALYLISNHSTEISSSKLKNILGFRSVHTVENYLGYLEEAFVVFTVRRFSFKLKEQLRAPRKVYAYDNGVINAYKFKISPDTGRLMENLVAVELLRRGTEYYYFRNSRGAEVDFVVKEGGKISALVQVCYDVRAREAEDRECRSLVKGSAELNCKNLIVITWDDEREEKRKDLIIRFIPLWKWLL